MYFVMRQEANPSARFCLPPPGSGSGSGSASGPKGVAKRATRTPLAGRIWLKTRIWRGFSAIAQVY